MYFAIVHFAYMFGVLGLFYFSLITKRLPWISNDNLKEGKVTNFLLLHIPALIYGVILSFFVEGNFNKVVTIISPIFTIGLGAVSAHEIIKKRVAKPDFNKDKQ